MGIDISGERKDNIIISLINELSEGADEDYLFETLNDMLSVDEQKFYLLHESDSGDESHVSDERKDTIINDLVDELSKAADEDYLNQALNNIFTDEEIKAYGIKQPDMEEEEIYIPSGR